MDTSTSIPAPALTTTAARLRAPARYQERRMEDLVQAPTLRPSEVSLLTGIKATMLHAFLTKLPEAERLPSQKIRGLKGRRGARLIDHATLRRWLAWKDWRDNSSDAQELASPEWQSFAAWCAAQETAAAAGKGRKAS